ASVDARSPLSAAPSTAPGSPAWMVEAARVVRSRAAWTRATTEPCRRNLAPARPLSRFCSYEEWMPPMTFEITDVAIAVGGKALMTTETNEPRMGLKLYVAS